MSPSIASATGTRVLTQLRRDPQTLGLVLVAPCAIVALTKYLLDDQPETFARIGGPMLASFPSSRCSSSPRSPCCASARAAHSNGC
jgi:ABC-2 type transport system permease protein